MADTARTADEQERLRDGILALVPDEAPPEGIHWAFASEFAEMPGDEAAQVISWLRAAWAAGRAQGLDEARGSRQDLPGSVSAHHGGRRTPPLDVRQ